MHVRRSPSGPRIALKGVVPGPCPGPVGWRKASRRYTLNVHPGPRVFSKWQPGHRSPLPPTQAQRAQEARQEVKQSTKRGTTLAQRQASRCPTQCMLACELVLAGLRPVSVRSRFDLPFNFRVDGAQQSLMLNAQCSNCHAVARVLPTPCARGLHRYCTAPAILNALIRSALSLISPARPPFSHQRSPNYTSLLLSSQNGAY